MTDTAARPETADQRGHILAVALELMSERGAHDTSMRRLADACELNVATLYHYFPSKADLLRSVIEDRRYLEQLAHDEPVTAGEGSPRERMQRFLGWLWKRARAEEPLIRLIIGESLRSDPVAAETVAVLLAGIDDALSRWLTAWEDDLHAPTDVAARIVRRHLIAHLVEAVAAPPSDPDARDRIWSEDLATLLVR